MNENESTVVNPEAAEAATDAPAAVASAPKKRKVKRAVSHGQIHVQATFNNTIISVTDANGGLLAASSAGACGFRGSKKGTAYAAQVAAEKAVGAARTTNGLSRVDIYINGIGLGRDAATRVAGSMDIAVESINDVTGVPHGGCRPPKARRA